MNQFWGIITLALVGIIVADILIHPKGVQAAGGAINNFANTTYNAMLGGGQ